MGSDFLAINNSPSDRAAALYSEFDYSPSGQRVFSRDRGCVDETCYAYRIKETLHLGFADRIIANVGTSKLTTDRYYIEATGGAFFSLDVIDRPAATGLGREGPAVTEAYIHRDRLGSISLLTSKAGTVVERCKFDAWGASSGLRANIDFVQDGATAWTRGFSGHDHIPQFALIHMNGRVYDPRLGVFLSVDPITSDPTHSTDLNSYAYAWNNPLTQRDISGYGLWESITGATESIGRGIGDVWNGARELVERNWREIVTVASLWSLQP